MCVPILVETASTFVAYAPHVVTIICTVLTVGVAAWIAIIQLDRQHKQSTEQLNKQHTQSIEQQRDNAREAMKVQIYERIADAIMAAESRLSESQVEHGGAVRQAAIYWKSLVDDGRPSLLGLRYGQKKLSEVHHASLKAVIFLVRILNRYEITAIDFKTFAGMLSLHIRKMMDFHMEFQQIIGHLIPTGAGDGDIAAELKRITDLKQNEWSIEKNKPIIRDQVKKIEDMLGDYMQLVTDAVCFLHDIRICAQTHFLGAIFDNKLEHRKPLDPKAIVLKDDPETLADLNAKLAEYQEQEQANAQAYLNKRMENEKA